MLQTWTPLWTAGLPSFSPFSLILMTAKASAMNLFLKIRNSTILIYGFVDSCSWLQLSFKFRFHCELIAKNSKRALVCISFMLHDQELELYRLFICLTEFSVVQTSPTGARCPDCQRCAEWIVISFQSLDFAKRSTLYLKTYSISHSILARLHTWKVLEKEIYPVEMRIKQK